MDPALLSTLCCPETGQALREATAEERSHFRDARELLVREDGRAAYPVHHGIPQLIVEEQVRAE